ncbi:MAG: hypothetical protein C0391_02100 [Anaerolinea sp.]|nr:hypothetical protein [Anaerolinea sp.]
MTVHSRSLSRADLVRSRRNKEMKQRVILAADVVKKPLPYTPIQTRNGEGVLPIIQKPRKRTRRKFYYKIMNKLEIKLPAIPVFNPGWRLVSAVIFLVSAFCIYTFYTSPNFTVDQVNLNGAERVTAEEIDAILPVKGQKILSVTPDSIEKVIKNTYPVVEEVRVVVGWPSSITIYVKERVPVLIWDQDNLTQWISADGVAFEPKGEVEDITTIYASGNPPSVGYNLNLVQQESKKPLASLSFPGSRQSKHEEVVEIPAQIFINPEIIPAIQKMAEQAPQGVNLVYSPTYGIGWVDPKGWQVYFGMQPDEMPQKLAAYDVIVEKLLKKDIHPALISMENLYAPYYRTEQ